MNKDQGRANKAEILIGVSYRPPNQDEETNEEFHEQLSEVVCPVLVLTGNFHFPDICWKYNTVQKKQSRTLLEYMKDNFLMKLLRETTRGGAPQTCCSQPED